MTFVHRRVLIGINGGGDGSTETSDWTSTGSATLYLPALPGDIDQDTVWAIVTRDAADEITAGNLGALELQKDTVWAIVTRDAADEIAAGSVGALELQKDTVWAIVTRHHKQLDIQAGATVAWQPVPAEAFADTSWAMVVTDGASEYFSAQAEADTAWAMVVADGADEYFSPQVEADTVWAMVVLQHKQWEPKGVATVTWDGEDATP